jgi:hypothetical protein
MAMKAGEAWSATGTGGTLTCGGGNCYTVTAGGRCATWCYQSLLAGYVILNDVGINCLCPLQGVTSWN